MITEVDLRVATVFLLLSAIVWLALGPLAAPAQAAPGKAALLPALASKPQVTDLDKETARQAYADVERLWGAGDLAGALTHADVAFRAVPNASTAILRATILDALAQPCDAFAALLVASDLGPTPEERAALGEQLPRQGALCTPRMAWATVSVVPPDAEVTVDGATFRAPRTVGLPLGEHAVRVAAPGYEPLEATLGADAVGPIEARYQLQLEPIPTALETPPEPPRPDPVVADPVVVAKAPPEDAPGPRLLPWFLIGGGAAALGTAVGMHVWAVDAADQTSRYAQPVEGLSDDQRKARFDQANEDMKLRGTLAYVFYGVGGAAVVAGTVLLFVDPWAEGDALAVRPMAAPGVSGLTVQGSF